MSYLTNHNKDVMLNSLSTFPQTNEKITHIRCMSHFTQTCCYKETQCTCHIVFHYAVELYNKLELEIIFLKSNLLGL